MMNAKEYREMTPDDLKKEIDGLIKSLFDLRFKKVTDVVENPAEFRKLRKVKHKKRYKRLGQDRSPRKGAEPVPTGSRTAGRSVGILANRVEGGTPCPRRRANQPFEKTNQEASWVRAN